MPATLPSEAPCRGHGPLPRATPVRALPPPTSHPSQGMAHSHEPPVGAGHARDADPQPAAITSISTINPGNASERTSTMVSAGHGALK